MAITKRKIVVLALAALMTAAAVFAGTSTTGPVDDAYAAKAGGAE